MHNFNYKWNLRDGYPAPGVKQHGNKVFSTFACGGGSSMGYKLAGYDVIAANDIDPQMARVYKANHNPKHYFECPITDLLTMDLPKELYGIDVLDGSPPCSTFSMAGSREKNWKKNKAFREGQSEQVLSDLFFDWIKLVDRLQPKVAIAENVKGMLIGNAKLYTKQIVKELNKIGYDVQVFLLNAASMGVPQRRERVFFICERKDLGLSKLELEFNEGAIPFRAISEEIDKDNLTEAGRPLWERCKPGKPFSSVHPKGNWFNAQKVEPSKPIPTITANQAISGGQHYHYKYRRTLTDNEYKLGGSYPMDYNFLDLIPKYLIGMSVPPVMMAQVSNQVYKQLLANLIDE